MNRLRAAIIGGGDLCASLIEGLARCRETPLSLRIIGVADPDPRAPGMQLARERRIPTRASFRDLFRLDGLNLLLLLTRDPELQGAFHAERPSHLPWAGRPAAAVMLEALRVAGEKRRAEKKYRDLFDGAREGVVFFDPSGRITECNYSLALLVGTARDRLEGATAGDLAAGVSRTILENHLDGLRSLGTVAVEMTFLRRDGREVPVEADIVWQPDAHLFRMTVRDISLRKKLEAWRRDYAEKLEAEVASRTRALRESEEEARLQRKTAEGIISGSPIPMYVLDRSHRVIYWNKACEKLTGYSAAQMIGTDRHWMPFYPRKRLTLADLVLDQDIARIRELYRHMHLRPSSMVEGGYQAEHFFPDLGPKGTHLYFNAAPILDDKGQPQAAVVTYQDFSERVRMTQEIRRRENFVQNLIQNSIDGIMATDPQGKIIIFNRGALELLGYEPAEIVGRMNYRDILRQETAAAVREAFYNERFGPPGKIINMELELLNKARETIPVRLSGTLLFEEGREVGSVVFIQDLRPVIRLQREKEQAQRLAAIGETVAGLAHYIKNILTAFQGGAYVIRSAMAKKDLGLVEKGWAMVERNIEQIAHIVTDMLIYSRERTPRCEPVDPNELVEEILDSMKQRARLSGVTLAPRLHPRLPPVLMDRTAIHRCLLNLVSNAVDACTLEGIVDGRGRVEVKTDRPKGWGVRFEVTDNGTGMDEALQQKLFTGFFTTKGYRGTGLGLPVTRKIVEEHGGKLTFTSCPGRGTTFALWLPEKSPQGSEADDGARPGDDGS